MDWEVVTRERIRHRLGQEIILVRGTWTAPEEIREDYVIQLASSKCIQLLCEGLHFAGMESQPLCREFNSA